jgi:hypothetical protein
MINTSSTHVEQKLTFFQSTASTSEAITPHSAMLQMAADRHPLFSHIDNNN